jgi:uncharacterized protein YegP (UPF0339 family)
MAGYYQLIEGYDGGFAFILRAGNHEAIFESRVFWGRQSTLDAVVRFRRLILDDSRLQATRNKAGQHLLHVLDDDQRLLGAGSPCASVAGLNTNRAALRRNAQAQVFRGLVRRSLVMS